MSWPRRHAEVMGLRLYSDTLDGIPRRRELLEDMWENQDELLAHNFRIESRRSRQRLDLLGAEAMYDLLRRNHPCAVPRGQRRRDVPQALVLKHLQESRDSTGRCPHQVQHFGE